MKYVLHTIRLNITILCRVYVLFAISSNDSYSTSIVYCCVLPTCTTRVLLCRVVVVVEEEEITLLGA